MTSFLLGFWPIFKKIKKTSFTCAQKVWQFAIDLLIARMIWQNEMHWIVNFFAQVVVVVIKTYTKPRNSSLWKNVI